MTLRDRVHVHRVVARSAQNPEGGDPAAGEADGVDERRAGDLRPRDVEDLAGRVGR